MVRQRDLVLGTAGHIDHGKTALVRALTGVDTDRLPAEKQRGITIDLGFAALDLGDWRVAMVDVPGHERFIRNMLAGASGVDVAMLVVAADDSVMPQTREHLEILRMIGVDTGLVVLTKCDLADPGWLGLVEDEIRTLVAGTFLEGSPIVRTSAPLGCGIDELRDELRRICEAAPCREDTGLFRMSIDRSFTVSGHGTVVTGTVVSGEVCVGDELEWWPEGRTVRVRGLQRHDRAVEQTGRGARAAINLVGIHHSEARRGQELGAPGYLEAARVLSVEVRATRDAARAIRHRTRYRVHLGTAEVGATLSLLEANELGRGQGSLGQLFLAEPVAAVYGQPFVIREESPPATLGGGRVLQVPARRIRRRDSATIGRLGRLRSQEPEERLVAALAFLGLSSRNDRALCRMTGLAPAVIPRLLAASAARGAVVDLPLGPRRSTQVVSDYASELEDRVVRALARLHAASPRQSAIPRTHLMAALPDFDNEAVIAAILGRLETRGLVVGDARTVSLQGHEPNLSQAERRLKLELADAIKAGGFQPPDLDDLSAQAGTRGPVVPALLTLLRDECRIIAIAPGLYLDFEIETELRRRVADRLSDGSTMTMAQLRDLFGTTRKYAVPIGEYLDRIGLTRRAGDERSLASRQASPDPSAPRTIR